MANPHRGGVDLKAGDAVYTLSFSYNALCELEDAFDGLPVPQIAKKLNDPEHVSIKDVRRIVWAALRDHHSDVDLLGAGEVITAAGPAATMDAIGKAFSLAFPDAEASEDVRPRTAKGRARSNS